MEPEHELVFMNFEFILWLVVRIAKNLQGKSCSFV